MSCWAGLTSNVVRHVVVHLWVVVKTLIQVHQDCRNLPRLGDGHGGRAVPCGDDLQQAAPCQPQLPVPTRGQAGITRMREVCSGQTTRGRARAAGGFCSAVQLITVRDIRLCPYTASLSICRGVLAHKMLQNAAALSAPWRAGFIASRTTQRVLRMLQARSPASHLVSCWRGRTGSASGATTTTGALEQIQTRSSPADAKPCMAPLQPTCGGACRTLLRRLAARVAQPFAKLSWTSSAWCSLCRF